jgi:hypothetical protein
MASAMRALFCSALERPASLCARRSSSASAAPFAAPSAAPALSICSTCAAAAAAIIARTLPASASARIARASAAAFSPRSFAWLSAVASRSDSSARHFLRSTRLAILREWAATG